MSLTASEAVASLGQEASDLLVARSPPGNPIVIKASLDGSQVGRSSHQGRLLRPPGVIRQEAREWPRQAGLWSRHLLTIQLQDPPGLRLGLPDREDLERARGLRGIP